tara:strand:- start:11811 stop:12326 length:516 start_codon:yes stop_codon:yes gene_type:complete
MPFVPPMQKVDEVLPEASSGTPMPEVKGYNPDIKVKTAFSKEIIEQTVAFPRQDSMFDEISKKIVFLQDEGINQALYKLGYLSPKQLLPLKEAYFAAKHNEGGVQRVMAELGRLFEEPALPSEKPEESAPEVVVRDKPKGPENEKINPKIKKMCGSFSQGGYVANTKPEQK